MNKEFELARDEAAKFNADFYGVDFGAGYHKGANWAYEFQSAKCKAKLEHQAKVYNHHLAEIQAKADKLAEVFEKQVKEDERDLQKDPDFFRYNRYAENRYWERKQALKEYRQNAKSDSSRGEK